MKNFRKMTWFILIIQVLFVIWIIVGTSSASGNCDGEMGDALAVCQAGTAIGTGIGIGLILFFWLVVDVILGLVWLITNRGQRDCPTCGRAVKKGQTQCRKCGHDFKTNSVKP